MSSISSSEFSPRHVLLKNLAEKRAAKEVEVGFLVKALKDAEADVQFF